MAAATSAQAAQPGARRFVARWDLDKTYLRTEFDSLRDLVRTALERPDQKRTVPGAASLLRELASAGGSIHILSGSPRQMRGRIEEKLKLDGATFDSLTLKPNLENMLKLRLRAVRDQLGYKLPALLRSRAQLSQRLDDPSTLPEVLLGDDAEADAFVYSLYADVCAGHVDPQTLATVMHRGKAYEHSIDEAVRHATDVRKAATVRRILIHLERQSPPSRFAIFGPRVVPFYNYLQAALVLAEDDMLPPTGVLRVAGELVVEHRFDADALARSYFDLKRRGAARGDLADRLRAALAEVSPQMRLTAVQELGTMCDLLERELPRLDAKPPLPAPPRPDYVALVTEHNQRHKQKQRFDF